MPSYEQSKSSKLWSVRFREIQDGKERNKRLSGFRTKREAQAGYIEYCSEREKQAILSASQKGTSPNEMLFDTLIDSYLDYTKSRVKESSYYDIENKIRNRIRPFFTGKRICDVKPLDILKWQQDFSANYSYEYCSWCLSSLSSIYKYGERYHDIINIMHKVDRPRNLEPKKEMKFWTREQFAAFIAKVDDPVREAFFRTLYITGCRRGEANALTWEDINLDEGTIRINKSLTHKTRNAPYKITTPKNASSNRTLQIPNSFCRFLADYKKALADRNELGAFVFGGNKPLPASTVDHCFRRACSEADVPVIRIHDLRHSCASLLISRGVSIVAVGRYLGHTNIQQTLNTYSHMMPDDQLQILNVMEEIT